ncbi:aspartic peptidase domain-containing protein [Mycena amicta]|nr:aspartic peptidase domain-containing protein [Mycena amicta]
MVRWGLAVVALSLALTPVDSVQLFHAGRDPSTSEDYSAIARRIRARYGDLDAGRIRRATDGQGFGLTDTQLDSRYYLQFSIGTPPKTFRMMLDPSTSDVFVTGQCRSGCNIFNVIYDPTASTSSKNTTKQATIAYAAESANGWLFTETMVLGSFSASSIPLLIGVNMTGSLITNNVGPYDGILGLGFGGLSVLSPGSTPFWQQALGSQSPVMAFYIERATGKASPQPGGSMTFGGTNTSLYSGAIEFLGLTGQEKSYWSLDVTGFSVNGKNIAASTTTKLAIFDTSTALIAGPADDMAALWAAVPNSEPPQNNDGFYKFPCGSPPTISFSFGGRSWAISTSDMSAGLWEGELCNGAIFPLVSTPGDGTFSNFTTGSNRPSWIFGNTFLKNVYTVLNADPPSVGFADLSTLAGGSGEPNSTATSTVSSSSPSSTTSNAAKSTGPGPGATNTAHNKKSVAGPVAGGVIGGVLFLVALVTCWVLLKRRRQKNTDSLEKNATGGNGSGHGAMPVLAAGTLSPLRRNAASASGSNAGTSSSPTLVPFPQEAFDPYTMGSNKTILSVSGIRPVDPPPRFSSVTVPSPAPPSLSPPPPGAAQPLLQPPALDRHSTDPAVLAELNILREAVRRMEDERGDSRSDVPPPEYASAMGD